MKVFGIGKAPLSIASQYNNPVENNPKHGKAFCTKISLATVLETTKIPNNKRIVM